jgi:hypothetical protein
MRVEKVRERLMLWCSPDEFMALQDAIPNVDRFSHEAILEEGRDNLVLDFPIMRVIAILENLPNDD